MSAASIEGKAFVLQDLFERWSYDIDYYQREFAWSADDVRTLVDDLITQFRLAKRTRARGGACATPTRTSWDRSYTTRYGQAFAFLSMVSSDSPYST
jgi:hypothetical protein